MGRIRFLVLLPLFALFACLPGNRDETADPGSEDPAGAATVPSQGSLGPAVPDSGMLASPDTGSAGPGPASTAGPVAGVEGGQLPVTTDSAGIQARLTRLEAENDSLRAAVGALLTFLTVQAGEAGEPPPEAPGPGAPAAGGGVAQDLLNVDTRQVQNWGLRIAAGIFFLAITGLFIRGVIWVLDKLAERNPKRRLLFKRMVPIARISLWFLAILFVGVVILRVEAQGLVAAGAAVGVAVGFAAQDILKNIFGGLIVLFDQPFQVGDKISVGGTYGEVVSIGLRSTRIVTPDDNLVSVPNAQVVDGQVANANAGELNCQVVTDLFLPGWVDEAEAKRIGFEAAASSKYVFLNKPIVVLVKDEFRETFLTHLKVKAYVLDPRYEFLFMSDVTERARAGFREAGLLGPMHGVRAYVDLDRFPGGSGPAPAGEAGE